jgi:NTE family protein
MTSSEATKYERVVCVMSGGGARAAAHVGAMRSLQEWGLGPRHYVGTSMGAVVAAAFASGLSYDEVLKRMMLVTRSDVARPSPGLLLGPLARSFLRAEPLKDTIRSLVPARRFSELRTPLTVTAVDNRNGQLVLFGEGGLEGVPLVEALYASCALPLYYPPASIGDREYVDGGLRAVLPLDVAREFEPDLLVAVAVGPSFFSEPAEGLLVPPMLQAHNDAMRFLMAAQTEEAIGRWKDDPVPLLLVRPHLEQRATFAVGEVIRYVEEGYREATRTLHRFLGVG